MHGNSFTIESVSTLYVPILNNRYGWNMALQQVAGEKSVNSPHGENLDQIGLSLTTLQGCQTTVTKFIVLKLLTITLLLFSSRIRGNRFTQEGEAQLRQAAQELS